MSNDYLKRLGSHPIKALNPYRPIEIKLESNQIAILGWDPGIEKELLELAAKCAKAPLKDIYISKYSSVMFARF